MWFPIIIDEKCDGCGGQFKCIKFCPHGVFEERNGKAWVANPLNCIEGCSACVPVCPRDAIRFPTLQPVRASGTSKPKDKGLLRKVKCKGCGKTFWTNIENVEYCYDCRRSRART